MTNCTATEICVIFRIYAKVQTVLLASIYLNLFIAYLLVVSQLQRTKVLSVLYTNTVEINCIV